MGTRPAGRHTASGGDNVLRAQVAVDDDPDDDPEDVDAVFAGVDVLEPLDDGVEELDVVDEVDVLEVVSDEVVDDPPSFLPSPEPPAAGAEALLAVERESVL